MSYKINDYIWKNAEFVCFFAECLLKTVEEMEGNLVIVESPAKAKTIQKFLGDGYVVKPSFGHIRDLQEKKLSVDINGGFIPEYVIPAEKKKVVEDLRKASSKAQTVWLASDEDREGEAISWHLMETLKLDPSKARRIVFHEITKDAILNAVKNPRSLDMNLVNAQQARRVLDRLVGFELSPVLWKKIQRGLSAGRVQSVALRLIVDKEREILAFKPEAFYRVDGFFDIAGTKAKGTLNTRFTGVDEARKFLEDSIGANYSVDSVEKKEGTRFPAPPFTTSTLQQEAARKLHFPVSVTMRVAQGLYEKGLITYMRTDSVNLSSLALGTAKQFITENFGAEYSHPRQFKTNSKGAQEAHEAIRPTYIANTGIEGSDQEKKLYSLIWKRTVASQMEEARVMNTSINVNSDRRPEYFTVQASQVLFDGFLKLYIEGIDDQDSEDENVILPEISSGTAVQGDKFEASCKYTQAPYRYSEATLVKKLEELGIGRPSTYAPTISTLTTGRGYVIKGDKEGLKVPVTNLTLKGSKISESTKNETLGAEKGKLLPRDIGVIVSDYLTANFPGIMDYDFTANVEKEFDHIAEGDAQWTKVIGKFYEPFHKKVDISTADKQFNHIERKLGYDPTDGEVIIAKFGQYGPFVQKGEGDSKICASLGKGQLIESITLEEALALFKLPRVVGEYEGVGITATKGKFGPYLKYGDKNISLPKGIDPVSVTLEECIELIVKDAGKPSGNEIIKEFQASDISVINGRYGPFIKHAGANYKIPAGKNAGELTEAECNEIIAQGPVAHKHRRYTKK